MKQDLDGNIIIKYLVVLGDFALLNIMILVFLNFDLGFEVKSMQDKWIILLTANIALAGGEYCFHPIVYERTEGLYKIIQQMLKMTLLQSAIMLTLLRVIFNPGGIFNTLIKWWSLFFAVVITVRIIELQMIRYLRKLGRNTRSVILIGDVYTIELAYESIMKNLYTGYKTIGYFSNNEDTIPEGLKRLGDIKDLMTLIEKNSQILISADEIFCNLHNSNEGNLLKFARFCDHNMIRFYYVPSIFGDKHLHLRPQTLAGQVFFTNHDDPLSSTANKLLKRTFDIIISSVICIILLPLIPIIALIIKKQSPGPIFFKQERTGLKGETFNCYKFRSMHVNEDADEVQCQKDDPRKFAFGNFMRKTNIDELPQFFNVFKGDMSIVGPRPHMLLHTEKYQNIINDYMVRHYCKPGITGLAQVRGQRGETTQDWMMRKRVESDIEYMETWTWFLDIKICLLTAYKMFFRKDKNAY